MAHHELRPESPQPLTALAELPTPTVAQVIESPDDFLDKLDVAVLNSICAVGLPGAEDLDIAKQDAYLNEAARQVILQTRANLDGFTRDPGAYDNSMASFCCNFLLQTLQELLGVRYNPARITDADFQNPLCINPDFRDARDLFIHGIIDGPGGTCASMPVMYASVARRAGYPLKLVEAPGHLFCRWEDPEGKLFNVPERFNVEGTGHGISFHPDDYYWKWPREWRTIERNSGCYLRSLSPAEELACFLATRGSCLEGNGRIEEAVQAFGWATKLAPDDPRYHSQISKLLKRSYEMALEAVKFERRMLESERRMLDLDRVRLQQKMCPSETTPTNFAEFRGPPHGDSCECLHCRQSRQAMQQQPQTPGHPVTCGCVNCRRGKSNPFSRW